MKGKTNGPRLVTTEANATADGDDWAATTALTDGEGVTYPKEAEETQGAGQGTPGTPGTPGMAGTLGGGAKHLAETPKETKGEAWLCRSCACILGVRYTYPTVPWVYCARAGCALTPDEQVVALAYLQLHRAAPPLFASPAGAGVQSETAQEILSIPEAAKLLRRSAKGLYRLAAAGGLSGATKTGGRWVVRRSVLLGCAAEGRVSPGRTRR